MTDKMDSAVHAQGFDFENWQRVERDEVEACLSRWVSADAPAGLGESMRYAVLVQGFETKTGQLEHSCFWGQPVLVRLNWLSRWPPCITVARKTLFALI